MSQPTLNVIDSSSIVRTINTINPNGQATSANSQSVVIASDQSPVPVTLPASSLVLGKVGIDQTTPGTTNAVQTTAGSIVKLGDGTNNAAIKAASTASAATDPSVVVALSPNSPAKISDGTNTVAVIPTILSLKTDLSSIAGTASVNGGVAGSLAIGGNGVDGAAVSGNSVQIGGSDGTNKQKIRAQADNSALGATGNVPVLPGQFTTTPRSLASGNVAGISLDASGAEILGNSNKPTFSYMLTGIAATTSTWNALTIEQPASATKTIYVKRFNILSWGLFSAAQVTTINFIRSSTASTVGNGAITWQKRDTADTATAVGRYGNSTSVTAGATASTDWSTAGYSGTTLTNTIPVSIDLTNGGSCKGLVIPKTNLAGLMIQIVGAAGGANLAISVEFTEE